VLAGTHAFGAICAALLRRVRSGRGASLDVSMLECLIAADDITFHSLLNGGEVWRTPRAGMLVHSIGGRHVAMQAVGAPHLLSRLLVLIGRPELAADERFATPSARRQNWPAFAQILREWLDRFGSVEQAVAALSAARIPSVPMLSPEEVVGHPQIVHRSVFPEVAHPVRGPVRVTATPFHIDQRPVRPGGPAPYRVGENTRQVLNDVLGYSAERVEALQRERVVDMPE
jgi:crotonobetainyl-CoA:carnitine CoA-transferase CaiB-like acyl-CoA transferase